MKPGAAPEIVKPKSRWGVREVPFLPAVREELIEHLAAEQRKGRGHDQDFVFVTPNGRPLTRQNVFERGIEKDGWKAGLGEDIRAHVLRRRFCTFVADDPSIPPSEAAALTGHDERVGRLTTCSHAAMLAAAGGRRGAGRDSNPRCLP